MPWRRSLQNAAVCRLGRPSRKLVYHYMWAPKDAKPCPMCTMWCDGYNAIEPYVRKRANFVLVAKAPIQRLRAWAKARRWNNIRLFSSYGTTFNADFNAEEKDGSQRPVISVFTRDRSGKVRHFYQRCAELSRSQFRGIDQLTPVWNLFDLLPSGRGNWFPNYES